MVWGDKPYHSLDYELKRQFGQKIYKVSLDGGMSCPNRDGTVGTGGCTFCSQGGSGEFAVRRTGYPDVWEQIEQARHGSTGRFLVKENTLRIFSPTPILTPR